MFNMVIINMEKRKNLMKQIIKGILVFFIFYYSSYLQLIPIIVFNIQKITGPLQVLLSCFSNILLVMILFFLYLPELRKEWKIFRKNLAENIDTGTKLWLVGLLGMMIANTLINLIFQSGQANNEQAVQSMIDALPWIMVINAGILAPFTEEIVFRKAFRNIFHNKWVFILCSGLCFGFMHVLGNSTTLADYLYFIPYSSLGMAFAYMYEKKDTVFTSISFHMFHNLALILASIFLY